MLNGLTVDLGGWDIDNYQLLYNINVKNLCITLIFSTLAENFCYVGRL